MNNLKICISATAILFSLSLSAQSIKVLFDATKAETANNADWVIDADLHNLGYQGGPASVGGGNEANAQRVPNPPQSAVTASTNGTYWNGALSSWAIDCVNQGYTVETLPYNGQITYGISSNQQDLSHYNVFIVCEPNILFSSSEKTAILHFIQNGGGLFMISDHDNSDRNGDGSDSPHIWNDLMANNLVQTNPFGVTFDYTSFSQTSTNIASLPADSILHGSAGDVSEVLWASGTSMTLDPTKNATVKGVVFKTGAIADNTNVLFAHARFGNGKVVFIGDSSPCDDGTGDPNDQLYDGYVADAAGNHRKLLMNATIWLAATGHVTESSGITENIREDFEIYPNPSMGPSLRIKYSLKEASALTFQLVDVTGKIVVTSRLPSGLRGVEQLDITNVKTGLYECQIKTATRQISKRIAVVR